MKVLILGCGPAGLMAAHAASRAGADPIILSRKRKSPMRGAQYLHSPVPGTPRHEFKVDYLLVGEVDGYREKIYGSRSGIETSIEVLQGRSPAWDIRSVYGALWATYGRFVVPWEADPRSVFEAQMKYGPDITISTLPAPLLCWQKDDHTFHSTAVLISEEARQIEPGRDNIVVCSGRPIDVWYRQSRIHGWENTEYPYRSLVGQRKDVALVRKPISTDCTCFPRIHRMGRYGRWTKGVLSHSAYSETMELVRGAEER